MELKRLKSGDYKNLRYKLMNEVEGNKPDVYWDSNQILTIGIGLNIDCASKDHRDTDYSEWRKIILLYKIGMLDDSKINSYNNNFQSLMKDSPGKDVYTIFINTVSDKIFDHIKNNRHKTEGQIKDDINRIISHHVFNTNILISSLNAMDKKNKESSLNDSDTQIKSISNFKFTLPIDEAEDLFNVAVVSYEKKLAKALRADKLGIDYLTNFLEEDRLCTLKLDFIKKVAVIANSENAIQEAEALWYDQKRYPQEFLPLLSNFYQQPQKFTEYDDAPAFYSYALGANRSRFLAWFAIRYYTDRTSIANATEKKKDKEVYANRYEIHSRRAKEAAVFGLIDRVDEYSEKVKYKGCLDIFTYLNIFMPKIPSYNNALAEYIGTEENTSFYTFLHNTESNDIDKRVQKINTNEGIIASGFVIKKPHVANDTSDSTALDHAPIDNILKYFTDYIEEKFAVVFKADEQAPPEFTVDKIYVSDNPNKLKLQNAMIQHYKNFRNTKGSEDKPFKIFIILNPMPKYQAQMRFDEIFKNTSNMSITLALKEGGVYYINALEFDDKNFRLLYYSLKDEVPDSVCFIHGVLDTEQEGQTTGLISYTSATDKDLTASFSTETNLLTVKYKIDENDDKKGITIYILNYIPKKKQAHLSLSNADKLETDPNINFQIGNMAIKITFKIKEENLKKIDTAADNDKKGGVIKLTYKDLDKRKYYLLVNDTDEIIDTRVSANETEAEANFKLNCDSEQVKNSKLIFSFEKRCMHTKQQLHQYGHDYCQINWMDIEGNKKEEEFLVNLGTVVSLRITGVKFVNDNNTDNSKNYLDTEYVLEAEYSEDVEYMKDIKWSYDIPTAEEYKAEKKEIKNFLSANEDDFLGKQIKLTPSKNLDQKELKALKANKKRRLVVFAYIKGASYRAHVVIEEKKK